MGYYTNYTLTQVKNSIPDSWFAGYIKAHKDDMYGVDEDGDTTDACKWYEHDVAMQAFSKAFPTTVFKLHGEGEESGDLWEKYYYGGKLLFNATVKMTFDQPDLSTIPRVTIEEAPVTLKAEPPEVTGRKFKKGL